MTDQRTNGAVSDSGPDARRSAVGAAQGVMPGVQVPLDTATLKLIPGARIAGGRYRLMLHHGSSGPLQFWQARDTALDRQVALTFVDPEGALPSDKLQEILTHTLRLSRIDCAGVARVLDVVRIGRGGLVVSEWIRGGSLKEVADTLPSPIGAVRAMQSLALAAEEAHSTGVALSIDHPNRIRVSIDGDVVLAYPATLPAATMEEDVRGMGAALYALLVDRWPLPESGADIGLAPAQVDSAGRLTDPALVNPDIPVQISSIAVRAVDDSGSVRTASAFLNLLQRVTAGADRTEALEESRTPPPPPPLDPHVQAEHDRLAAVRRRRNVLIGAGVGVTVIVVALVALASVLNRVFDVHGDLSKEQLGLNAPSPSTSLSVASPTVQPGAAVKPIKISVFSPDGGPDNPGQAGLAIDGDPTTSWQTDIYSDPDPFPGFKNGVGLLLELPKATKIGSVTIDTHSVGTKVEIRSSPTPDPAKLDDTTVLAPATALQPGRNTIPVKAATQPTSTVLVWISTLGSTDGKSRADIAEITITPAT